MFLLLSGKGYKQQVFKIKKGMDGFCFFYPMGDEKGGSRDFLFLVTIN